MAFLNESHLEEEDIRLFEEQLGYLHLDGSNHQLLGRETLKEVVLRDRLLAALQRLNPELPSRCLEEAMMALTRSRVGLTAVRANKEVYTIIRDGWPVSYEDAQGQTQYRTVRILDLDRPATNEFAVVSQLTIEYQDLPGKHRRPDLLLYVNGLPLVMIELKNATQAVKAGYDVNLHHYKEDIPQLFWYNCFVCLSNGVETRLGAFAAEWGHFFSWVKLKDPAVDAHQLSLPEIERRGREEKRKLSLEYFAQGLCQPAALLDYFENFVLYYKGKAKIIAKNHQFLGVNNAIKALENRADRKGKLGVFWHTQGSGKSFSMIFFARKVRRKVPGNWSFLILTDRSDLDDQIYQNFKDTETVHETNKQKKHHFRPRNREQLREYLQSNRSFLFTLIHKFGIQKGKAYPQLTDRDDWIVMVDEAHRTQYKGLADNMRIALPNAQFMAFTGTPLLRSELTRDWFGPYISEYNFAQSIEDGATVPLFYKKSVPRVEQVNEDLSEEAAQILEAENLTDAQRQKLDREYSTLFQVIKREDRLQEIARHIVRHYPYRLDVVNDAGARKPMKAMVVSIDKFTAVRMYELVQAAQKEEIKQLRRQIAKTRDSEIKARYQRALDFMQETRMAAVISQEGSDKQEQAKFAAQGLDISPHRRLMDQVDEGGGNIESYFKDANNTYRMVFVTAMWLTGFDAPAVSTLYLDKPLQNHTLMQAIARTNRVFDGKPNGLIVDYFGVFRNLEKALAAYAEGSKGQEETEVYPVQAFSALLEMLQEAIAEAKT
ncbi:MAG: type I restriction endonuclease subunit R, partial [Bacteroidota bacterium]